MNTKLDRVATRGGGTQPEMKNQIKKTYIYTYTIPIATKLGTVKTYNGEIPPTNSRNL